jgi:hypothetical protein
MAGMMPRIQLARWSLFPGVATPTLGTHSAALPLPRLVLYQIHLSRRLSRRRLSQQPHHRFPPKPGESGDSMGMCIWGPRSSLLVLGNTACRRGREVMYVMRIYWYGHCDAGMYLQIRTRYWFLAWIADVDSLTQLGCKYVSRFRRACHITLFVASSSVHVCLHGLFTLGIVTNVLMFTHRRLPWF